MEITNKVQLFIGAYSDKISRVEFDPSASKLSLISTIEGVKNSSFLYYVKEDKILISVSETQDKPLIVLIDLDIESPNYQKVIQELPTHGADPCHIAYSRKHHLIFVSNYSGSSMSYYSYKQKQLSLVETINYEGNVTGEKGNKERQEAPHPHSVVLDTTENYAFLQDLGCDLIRIYELNSEGKPILLKRSVQIPYGNGPRHMFNKNDRFYLISELTHVIFVYDFDRTDVDLKQVTKYPLLNENNKENYINSSCAEIKVDEHDTIYATCRHVDRLFIVKQKDQALENESPENYYQPSISTLGSWPRNFNLTNKFIFVANQKSNNLVVFDKQTNKQITQLEVQTPVYVEILDH